MLNNYFSNFHRLCFSNVKLPSSTRQSKCDKCLELKESRKNATNEQDCLLFQEQLKKHNKEQIHEKQLYYARYLQAKQQPDQFISLNYGWNEYSIISIENTNAKRNIKN